MRDHSAKAGSGVGKRERRKAWTRQELLFAGRKLFSKKGLYESRIEDLTRQAGIAKGTLYQYFRDKDELIREVVASGFAELDSYIERHARGAESLADLVERISAAHFEFFDSNPDLMRVFHQVRGLLKFDHRRWKPLRSTLREHLQRIADLIGTVPSRVRLSRTRRWELAILIFGAASGIASVKASVQPKARPTARPGALPGSLAAMVLTNAAAAGSRTPRPTLRATRRRTARPVTELRAGIGSPAALHVRRG
jgi:AcrR family transcriptional regulator